jgi:hypothetical protein
MGSLIFKFILGGQCFIISLQMQHTFEDVNSDQIEDVEQEK